MPSRPSRFLSTFHAPYLDRDGLKMGDVLAICPAAGASKSVKLIRTSYEIHLSREHNIKLRGTKWDFPKLDYPESQYVLEVVYPQTLKTSPKSSDGRYLLRSIGAGSFRLNGAVCFEAFLQHGDELKIGHHLLKVKKAGPAHSFEQKSCPIDQKLIDSDLNILLTGESGTGKTRMAKDIHDQGPRMGQFVHVNLASFSPSLIESELFGHVKGAFTGANVDKRGAFLQADRGTLFLDEIDSLPWDLQTKLLLFLENRKVRPVGGEGEFKSRARLIFASGRDLKTLVQRKQMRRDFYFRIISGVSFNLPSLRKSPSLIERICLEFAYSHERVISPALIRFYQKLLWPGNIRQLVGHLEKKLVFTKGIRLELNELDHQLASENWQVDLPIPSEQVMTLEELKKDYCQQVYQRMEENMKVSSEALGVSRNTLRCLLRSASQAA